MPEHPPPPVFSTGEPPDFRQSVWDDHLAAHVAARARDWLAEDLGQECDWTSVATVDRDAVASLSVVCRRSGVIAGLDAGAVVARVADEQRAWRRLGADGTERRHPDLLK
jgi:nicotinate-nucleotide pyrophosphorylase